MKEIKNRKAYYNYSVIDEIEAGIVLTGSEVKSCSNGMVDISEGYITIDKGELFVHNININVYKFSSSQNNNPIRKRKLLAHKKEILKLHIKCKNNNYNLIPLKLYENHGKIKLLFGMCCAKKNYDKREVIKNREIEKKLRNIIKGN